MKEKKNKPLKVVIVNPPTKEQAKTIIKNISRELSDLYSKKINVLEETK